VKTQKSFTLSDEALHQLAALSELYQTSTKALEVAIYALYQEKRKERRILTTVERKAGIEADDSLAVVVTACGYGLFTVSSPDAGAANVAAHWLLMTGAAQVIGKVDSEATGRMYFYLQAL
jgi:hypothetical protein